MKYDKRYLREYISKIVKQYLAEAEEEKADAGEDEGGEDEAGGNPFAAGGDDKGGDEGGEEKEGGEDEKGGDEKGEEGGKGGASKPSELEFGFDVSAVKKYNKGTFLSNRAIPKKITKQGIVATVQPDGVDILIGFDDITEITNKFFKNKK